ncbi:MAG: hypothetical protein ABSE82_11240 [Nitrososphaerales archaeon]|jgi:hypothetical protein
MQNGSREKLIDDLLTMSDERLIRWTLSGEHPEGYIAELGRLVFELRFTKRNLDATANMTLATRRMAIATWAIAAITLVTQIALIMLTFRR